MNKRWVAWTVFAVVVLVVLLYPERLTIVPAYHVKLIDQYGKPLANTGVSELWQLTSSQLQENLELKMTDAQGEADLPARTTSVPIVERILGCLAYLSRNKMSSACGRKWAISGAGDLKEMDREESVSGILNRKHSLVLTLKRCDINEPMLC